MVQRIRTLGLVEIKKSLEFFAKLIYKRKPLTARAFRSFFGALVGCLAMIWSLLGDNHNRKLSFGQNHFLWAYMWLKQYSTETVLSGIVGCSEKTFRNRVRQVLAEINRLYSDVVSDIFKKKIKMLN